MARQPWVLAMEGMAPESVVDVDGRLWQIDGYLGAMEIYLANPVHWVLYDRKLVAAYRLRAHTRSVCPLRAKTGGDERHRAKRGRIRTRVSALKGPD